MYMSNIYFEKYAQLTLSLTDFGNSFLVADKPDLQDLEHNIGIEVVCVETPEEGIKRSVWNQFAGKGLTSNEFRDKFEREDFRQSVIPDLEYMVMNGRYGNAKTLIVEMLDFIRRKNKKFTNYKQFEQNGLYLFNCHMFPEQIGDLQQKIFKEDFHFDFYIVNLINKLYIIFKSGTIKEYNISHEQLKSFKQEALEYEKNNQ